MIASVYLQITYLQGEGVNGWVRGCMRKNDVGEGVSGLRRRCERIDERMCSLKCDRLG